MPTITPVKSGCFLQTAARVLLIGDNDLAGYFFLGGVLTAWFAAQVPERGDRMASRDEEANQVFVTEEPRRQAGCPARE